MTVCEVNNPDSSAAAIVKALTVDPGSNASVIARFLRTLKSVMFALLCGL